MRADRRALSHPSRTQGRDDVAPIRRVRPRMTLATDPMGRSSGEFSDLRAAEKFLRGAEPDDLSARPKEPVQCAAITAHESCRIVIKRRCYLFTSLCDVNFHALLSPRTKRQNARTLDRSERASVLRSTQKARRCNLFAGSALAIPQGVVSNCLLTMQVPKYCSILGAAIGVEFDLQSLITCGLGRDCAVFFENTLERHRRRAGDFGLHGLCSIRHRSRDRRDALPTTKRGAGFKC